MDLATRSRLPSEVVSVLEQYDPFDPRRLALLSHYANYWNDGNNSFTLSTSFVGGSPTLEALLSLDPKNFHKPR